MADGTTGEPLRRHERTPSRQGDPPVPRPPADPHAWAPPRAQDRDDGQAERGAGGPLGAASRRSLLAGAVPAAFGLTGLLAGCGGGSGPAKRTSDGKAGGSSHHSRPSSSPSPSPSPTRRPPELPRGGRTLFPTHRLFGYCGLPGAAALGRLGTGDPGQRADEIVGRAHDYAHGRTVLPVFELLACVANASPGPDRTYRTRTSSDTIGRFHDLAREHDAMLLLNVQPGRALLLDEVKALRRWLVHPDVGLALDPEWEMGSGQVPGKTYGHTSGAELNSVARYLADLVEDRDLPEKPLVFHQVALSVVKDRDALRPRRGVVPIMSADGIGSPGLKRATWHQLVRKMPEGLHTGFKLFYDEDTRGGAHMMSPKDVLALKPQPEYVMYE